MGYRRIVDNAAAMLQPHDANNLEATLARLDGEGQAWNSNSNGKPATNSNLKRGARGSRFAIMGTEMVFGRTEKTDGRTHQKGWVLIGLQLVMYV